MMEIERCHLQRGKKIRFNKRYYNLVDSCLTYYVPFFFFYIRIITNRRINLIFNIF